MRLRRIEAVRYGSLADAALAPLGDGLSVVCGPNEAGKSTFTSLVRHVLYGYPTQRDSETGYFFEGGGRLGRLVFEDASGSWVIERAEGPRGGAVAVRTVTGDERPALATDLTRGVSARAYRIVFGFGLGEMAEIEGPRGSEDDIIARLYAASTGLRISPQEVRASLEREAAELFKPRGRTPVINSLAAEAREVRGELRRLRTEAAGFHADQERLQAMRTELQTERTRRDGARLRATELTVAADRAEERVRTLEAQEQLLLDLRRKRSAAMEEADAIVLDAALLGAAPELDALIAEAAGYAQQRTAAADAAAALANAEGRYRELLDRVGLPAEVVTSLAGEESAGSVVETARGDLQRLELQAQDREERVARVSDDLSRAGAEATAALRAAVGSVPDDDDSLAAVEDRRAALEAIEALQADRAGSRGRRDASLWVMLVCGALAVVAGSVLREWVTVTVGAVLLVVALIFILRARSAASLVAECLPHLQLLGLTTVPGPVEVSRIRRAHDMAIQTLGATRDAADRLREAERDAEIARTALAERAATWAAWLGARHLDPALSPLAASGILSLARDAANARREAVARRTDLDRIEAVLADFAGRLDAAARPHLDLGGFLSPADVALTVSRLREALATVRAQAQRRQEIERDVASFNAHIAAEEDRATGAARELRDVLARFGLEDGGRHDDLRVMQAEAERAAREADDTFETLARAVSQLEERLQSEARERTGVELSLREAGIRERVADAVERYVALTASAGLLARAQERYERERQPEVVRHAARIFSVMTGGRYPYLTIPLGGGAIEVFDTHAAARTSAVLSRGTAEQLYLALRLGLIAQLGETGRDLPVLMDDVLVNFDPQRKQGAARAIADLASERQIVFFTCHPETAALFAEVAPEHQRITLSGPGCAS